MATTSTTFGARFRGMIAPSERLQLPDGPTVWRERLPLLLVVAVALTLAVTQYRQFLDAHRQLWYSGTHDRSAHYLYAQKLAGDLRNGRVFRWLEDVNSARVWTPLQAILASATLAVGGYDYRIAVWPSLAGWVLTIVFGFLVARRLVPRGGNLAGAIAVLFIGLSPAHRAFATDVMLESLGAGLSLAVLYAYLVTVQREGGERSARWLGIALTALFLHKYNYWLLVLLAVAASETLYWRRELLQAGRAYFDAVDWRGVIRSQLRTVSNYALLVVLGLVVAIQLHGDRPFIWRGRELTVFPPHNVMQIAYWIVFIRLLVWWRNAGRVWTDSVDVRLQQVIRWHLWPAAWWLALPKHVGPFVWYLTFGNRGDGQDAPALQGLKDYVGWSVSEYHVAAACALLALGLTIVALLAARKLNRGGTAVFALFLVAAFLSVMHPNRKARNLHSWIPAVWVCAGAGAAVLVHGRLTARQPSLRPWLAAATLGGVAFAHFANGVPQAHALEGGPQSALPCLLDVTDCYLPDLDGNRPVTILSAVSLGPLGQWTFIDRYGSLARLEDHRFAFGPAGEPNRQAFREWMRTTSVEMVVFIEAMPGPLAQTSWEAISETPLHAELRDVLNEQEVFRLTRREEFPRHGCAVTVWKRGER